MPRSIAPPKLSTNVLRVNKAACHHVWEGGRTASQFHRVVSPLFM